ncbi:hypothetical protein TWF694_008123 [Orbilia ellipsospora]|uniref:Uncharacterized protein n=1 Tax=Orbilia ellipsospora TaxID=2528407 RepID=A0AAV9XGE5_9PEZI
MRLRNLKASHAATILALFSIPITAQNQILTRTFDQFSDIGISHALPIADLSLSLDEITNLVTTSEPLVDLPGGVPNDNTLPTLVSKALTGMDRIEPRVRSDATKYQAFVELRQLVADIPNLQITLKKDIWSTREAQPWSRSLWTVISELSDYLINGPEVDITNPDTVLIWLYQADIDSIVGSYLLDQTKADDILLACGHISDIFTDLRDRIYELLDILGGTLETRGQSRGEKYVYLSLGHVRNLNEWLNPYRNVFADMYEDLEDLYNPNYNGLPGLGMLGAVLGMANPINNQAPPGNTNIGNFWPFIKK